MTILIKIKISYSSSDMKNVFALLFCRVQYRTAVSIVIIINNRNENLIISHMHAHS